MSAADARALVGSLADLVVDCVDGGASIGFMAPPDRGRAEGFWRDVAARVEVGERVLIVAFDPDGAAVGTVQLGLAQPDNQPHRADLAKMLVHRRARRHGVGAGLMRAAEAAARAAGKTLLVLDTASADAERLYGRAGWTRVGVVPGYALLPDGRPCDTTYFFKRVD